MSAAPRRVVVVGGGLAGARAAQELRAQGFAGEVVLLAAEAHLPYDRPPLSKEVLRGGGPAPVLDVDWAGLGVDLRRGVRALSLHDGGVRTDAGDVGADGVVLATGAVPVRIGEGAVLRTLDDALALRRRLVPGARVVVVGAGWIGAEVATAAAAAGGEVVVLEAGDGPLAGALGAVGARTAPWYAAAGVALRTRTRATAVHADRVELEGGEVLRADVVVVGVGARPDTDWLAGSPVAVDRGVLADRHLRAAPGVVAVGDCAAWESGLFGTRLRVEHWDDALQAPAVAVTTLLGGEAVHDPVPYFWSEQLGHRLQHAGHAEGADQVVDRGDPDGPDGWTTCWLRDGRLVALLAVDRPRDLLQGRRLIAARATPDPVRLGDPDVPLKQLA